MNKHVEPYIEQGVYHSANACRICDKWLPPWMCGVALEDTDLYCWGHHWAVLYRDKSRIVGPFASEKLAQQYRGLTDGLIVEMEHG